MNRFALLKILLFRPTFVLNLTILFLLSCEKSEDVYSSVDWFMTEVYQVERAVIENIPIYEDYATPAREARLRRYLQSSHIEIARQKGAGLVQNDDMMQVLKVEGKLIPVTQSEQTLYYFYNVPERYRLLTPDSVAGLNLIAVRFQEVLNRYADLPDVKISISSVLRPVSYQNSLRRRNMNATLESTHSYGVSFDIFYDSFYVVLPQYQDYLDASAIDSASITNNTDEDADTPDGQRIINRMRSRMGFLLGDALRRQLQSVLLETLIELQDEGLIYAIIEKNQRCYHVTIL